MSTHNKPSRSKKQRSKKQIRRTAILAILGMAVYLRFIYDWVIDFLFSKFYGEKKGRLPSIDGSILTLSAVSLADKIRNKKLTSENVVKEFIEQIKSINPSLNGLVDERYEAALSDARDVDKFLASTTLSLEELKVQKPFLGVPFTSKESVAAKGMNFSFGLLSRRDIKGAEDADIVEKTKESGAILIGVTNVPELNFWCETRNNVYGQTNNPYDLSRIVGGSSGGEASLLAACGTPIGLGTDIGGSARMPGFYCGVFGHKPTTGLTSTRGMTFRTGNEKETMVCGGPMTKYAVDIIPLLRVLLGSKASFLTLDEEVNLKTLKVLYVEEPGDMLLSPISDSIRSAMRRVVNHFNTVTDTPAEKIAPAGFRYSYKLWKYAMTKEVGNFAYEMSNKEREVSLWTELPLLLTGCTQYTLPCLMRLFDLNVLPAVKTRWAEEKLTELKTELLEALGEDGVLLFPSAPQVAPHHYVPFFRPYNFSYWAIFNALNLPVTQVPLGLDSSNLPVGIQVVSAPYKDHLCIAVAAELEKVFGGWVPPFTVNK